MTQTSSQEPSSGNGSFGEGIMETDTSALMRELPANRLSEPEPAVPQGVPPVVPEATPPAPAAPEAAGKPDHDLLGLFGLTDTDGSGQLIRKLDQLILAIVGLVLVALFFILYYASAVFFPILLACMLNLLLSPSVRGLKKIGIPNSIGAALVMLAGFLFIGLSIYYLSEPATDWAARAPQSMQQVKTRFKWATDSLDKLSKTSKQMMAATEGDPEEEFMESLNKPMKVQVETPPLTGADVLDVTSSFASTTLATLILLYFLLAAGDRFLEKTVQLMPTYEEKWKVVEIIRNIERGISGYLFNVTMINIGLGLVIGFGLWWLEMPNPFLWGAMATFMNYIPYLGAILGTAIVAIVALIEPSFSPGWALLPPLWYLFCTTIEGNFVTPMILGYNLDLNPVVIFVWLLFWGWMWGIPGAILAVPILAAFKILCDHVKFLKPVGTFLVQ